MLYGAVFVPSADDKLATMMRLAQPKSMDNILDLGSGDGKVVLALARQGLRATGVEINPLLVSRARAKAAKLGLSTRAKFIKANFWQLDLSQFDLIFVYGITYIMPKLEQKLQAELRPGSRVVSNYFPFPNWPATVEENEVRVYLKR